MNSKKIIPVVLIFILVYVLTVGHECVFLKYFNVICPGCGMTRAIKAVMEFKFKDAFLYHPMVYSLPLIFVYIIKNGKVIKNNFINNSVLVFIGLGFLINYILRLKYF